MKHKKMMKGLKKIAKRPEIEIFSVSVSRQKEMEKDAKAVKAAMKRIKKLEAENEELRKKVDKLKSRLEEAKEAEVNRNFCDE